MQVFCCLTRCRPRLYLPVSLINHTSVTVDCFRQVRKLSLISSQFSTSLPCCDKAINDAQGKLMKNIARGNPATCTGAALLCLASYFAECQPSDTLWSRQKDLIDYTAQVLNLERKSEKNREKGNTRISFIPIAPGTSGGERVAVSAINAAFYLGDSKLTNLSSIYFYPFSNFGSRGGIVVFGNLWTDGNRWNIPIDLRWLRISLKGYALGGGTGNNDYHMVDYDQLRSYVTFNHLIIRKFYIGVGYNLDAFYQIKSETGPELASQTTSSGITFNMLRDSRRNSINPTAGFYTSLIFRLNSKDLGSSENWNSLYFDGRKYFAFARGRPSLIALRTLYWGTFGNPTYFDLPGTFMDLSGRAGRGYFIGRYRGRHMLYLECEYRLQLSSSGFWGMVFFINGQSFTEPDSGKFEYILPAAGVGLRMKLNKKSDMNITLDFAVGKDSPFNWYLNLGEFF